MWHGSVPTEAGRQLRVETNGTNLWTPEPELSFSGWLTWAPAVTVGLVHFQTGTSSRVDCVTPGPFTPCCYRLMLLKPSLTHSCFHASRVLGCTGTSLEIPHSLLPLFLAPSSATPTEIFVRVHVRLDLQEWMQCAQLLMFCFFSPHICLFTLEHIPIYMLKINNEKKALQVFENKKGKTRNMSINSTRPFPLISLTSWIIHSQLELRGWSRLHGTSAFSVIHLLS